MKIFETIIEKSINGIISDMEKLTEELEIAIDAKPIEQANITLRNNPIVIKLMRKQMLLTILKGV